MSEKKKPNTICTICNAQYCGQIYKHCLSCANELLLMMGIKAPTTLSYVIPEYKKILRTKRKEFGEFLKSIRK